MASSIHFKYCKNIWILRLHEQFSRNDSEMAPEKISNFKIMNIQLKSANKNQHISESTA